MRRIVNKNQTGVWTNTPPADVASSGEQGRQRELWRAFESHTTKPHKLELNGHSGPASIQIRPQTLWPTPWLPPGVDGPLSSAPGHTQIDQFRKFDWRTMRLHTVLKIRIRGRPPGIDARRHSATRWAKTGQNKQRSIEPQKNERTKQNK
jgi:hypothetical protein